jgi:guanylate kinase
MLSVSCTTREPRPGEVDGRDYRFVPPELFDRLIGDGAFLEWAEVFGHRYGTLAAPIEAELSQGRNAILEIDVQGAAAVRSNMPEAVLIFLAPPSDRELARRLRARRTESGAELDRRLAAARSEMDQRSWFDHIVVNDEIDRAAGEVAAIIDSAAGAGS